MSYDVERNIDAIEVEVFSNRILAIIEEMGAKLVRSSFSPNIKERQDCSVALFDGKGRAIGQAAHIPIHLGSLKGGVDAVLRDFDLDDIEEGDAFICNDAYLAGGTHLPDTKCQLSHIQAFLSNQKNFQNRLLVSLLL